MNEGKMIVSKYDDLIVLKVVMYCDDCKRRVKKALRPFTGLDLIGIDMDEQTVTLRGKADLEKLVEAVREKTHRHTELIFPLLKKESKLLLTNESYDTTLELMVDMNCETCAYEVREVIMEMDGVSYVDTNMRANKVIVKGHNIDGKVMCHKVWNEAGRHAELITISKKPIVHVELVTPKKPNVHVESVKPKKQVVLVEVDPPKKPVVLVEVVPPKKPIVHVEVVTPKKQDIVLFTEEKKEEKKEEITYAKEEGTDRIYVINNHYYPYQSTLNANNQYAYSNGYPATFSDENPNACTIM